MWIRQTTSNILVTARNYEESTDRLNGGVEGKPSGRVKGGKTKVLCDGLLGTRIPPSCDFGRDALDTVFTSQVLKYFARTLIGC